jgi:hypothetical protein
MDRELVTVEDCSTDGICEILQRLSTGLPQICPFRDERNAGKGADVRTAIEKAPGDFSLIRMPTSTIPSNRVASCFLCTRHPFLFGELCAVSVIGSGPAATALAVFYRAWLET